MSAKEKCLVFRREDGSALALPLRKVAEARAKYYAERDKDTTFESELEYVMNDDFEGVDWYHNQQNPEDFEGYFELSPPKDLTLAELIKGSETSIEEVALPTPPTPEQIQNAQTQIADAYLEAQLQALHLLGHTELNYIKTAVEMPNGGKYLLSFNHVDGPKTDVQELFRQRAERAKK